MIGWLDRDAAREVLRRRGIQAWRIESWLDSLEGCVRPAPAQTIDRDALKNLLWTAARHGDQPGVTADSILALLRPVDREADTYNRGYTDGVIEAQRREAAAAVDGVTLTREEAVTVRTALHRWAYDEPERRTRLRALAARLEAAS